MGAGASSETVQVGEHSAATRGSSEEVELNWSPEQIAGWLKRAYPEDEHSQVSHETIYRSRLIQARGVLKKELVRNLQSKRTIVDRNGQASSAGKS